MTKIRKFAASAIAVSLALSLVACGTTSTTSEKGSSVKGADTQAAASAEPAKKVKIILYEKKLPSEPDEMQQSYDLRLKRFQEKYPNVEIEVKGWVNEQEYRQEYDKALMAGNAPTVNRNLPYVDIPARIANGTVADITKFVGSWDLKKENKVWTAFDDAISKDGKWYAIPYKPYISCIPYNAKALKAAGVDTNSLPKTWDEFGKLGTKLTDPSKPQYGILLLGMDWNAWEFTPWVWSAGGEMIRENADGTYKIAFNEDPGVDAAMFWHDLIWKYKASQKNVLEDWDAFQDDIASGRGVFGFGDPTWTITNSKTKYGFTDEDFGEIPFPTKDASIPAPSLAGGEVWTFNPKADDDQLQAAWNYATMVSYDDKFYLEEQKLEYDNNCFDYGPAPRLDLQDKKMAMNTTMPEQWKKDFTAASLHAKPEPYCPNWGDLKNEIAKPLQKIILKENITRDETKKILDDCAETLYKKFPDSFKK